MKVLKRLGDDHKDMKAWLQEDPDSKPDLELWEGVDVGRSQYTLGDLADWFDLKDKQKLSKKPAVKKKGQEASGSGSGKGKDKAKDSVGGKKSHKKVTKE